MNKIIPALFFSFFFTLAAPAQDVSGKRTIRLNTDAKLSQLAYTQFHFSPGAGYVVPAGRSGFFSASTHYITGFKRASILSICASALCFLSDTKQLNKTFKI